MSLHAVFRHVYLSDVLEQIPFFYVFISFPSSAFFLGFYISIRLEGLEIAMGSAMKPQPLFIFGHSGT